MDPATREVDYSWCFVKGYTEFSHSDFQLLHTCFVYSIVWFWRSPWLFEAGDVISLGF